MTSPTARPRISSKKPKLSPGELLTEGERERLDAINRELDRRLTIEDAKSGLVAFTEHTFPRYQAEPFHRLVAAHLDRVIAGDIRRLMIFAPPQHGKSELTSVRFPAYWLGRRPDDPVIITSYAAELAYSKSRQARQVVESEEFRALFPDVRTNPESRAVNNWGLAPPYRGELLAAGVGGPVTGHGAMLGIIDDPVENWEQAQSEAYRNRAWEWYRGTFRTRIWEEGSIVLIMTRWHESDLAGKLLAMDEGEWTVLRLPALSEGAGDPLGRGEDEPLAPGRYSKDALLSLKRDVGSMAWAAEYQGTPRAPDGNRFKRHWFDIVAAGPAEAWRIRAWDKAGTKGGGDYTAGLLMAWVPGGYWYVEDVVRGQWSSLERETVIRRTAEADRDRFGQVDIWVEQEPGSSGKDSAEYTIRNLAGFSAYAERASGTKEVRAEPVAAQCEAGNVKLVKGHWNEAFIDELTSFPNGSHDDQCVPAGTLVATPNGETPIEDVRSGSFVLTRHGAREVLWAGQTGLETCICIDTSCGTLYATANHPVWVEGNGFVPAARLQEGDELCAVAMATMNRSSSGAVFTEDTRTRGSERIGSTTKRAMYLVDQTFSIGRYGALTSVRYRMVTSSTTRTKTRLTMTSRISFACRRTRMAKSTRNYSGQRSIASIWPPSVPSPPSGMQPKKAEGGMPNMAKRLGRSAKLLRSNALFAARPSMRCSRSLGSARRFAGSAIEPRRSDVIGIRFARYVAKPFSARPALKHVRVLAVHGSDGIERPVFNIRVDGEHEFFANNVLVHNCDAFSGAFNKLLGLGEQYTEIVEDYQPVSISRY